MATSKSDRSKSDKSSSEWQQLREFTLDSQNERFNKALKNIINDFCYYSEVVDGSKVCNKSHKILISKYIKQDDFIYVNIMHNKNLIISFKYNLNKKRMETRYKSDTKSQLKPLPHYDDYNFIFKAVKKLIKEIDEFQAIESSTKAAE